MLVSKVSGVTLVPVQRWQQTCGEAASSRAVRLSEWSILTLAKTFLAVTPGLFLLEEMIPLTE